MHDHRGAPCGWVAMQGWRRPMALNGTGIEFGKSEHDSRRRISRATTISADFILLGQRCGVQVVLRKVGHTTRHPPVWSMIYVFLPHRFEGGRSRTHSETFTWHSPQCTSTSAVRVRGRRTPLSLMECAGARPLRLRPCHRPHHSDIGECTE